MPMMKPPGGDYMYAGTRVSADGIMVADQDASCLEAAGWQQIADVSRETLDEKQEAVGPETDDSPLQDAERGEEL